MIVPPERDAASLGFTRMTGVAVLEWCARAERAALADNGEINAALTERAAARKDERKRRSLMRRNLGATPYISPCLEFSFRNVDEH